MSGIDLTGSHRLCRGGMGYNGSFLDGLCYNLWDEFNDRRTV